jgi:hypothetical protein
MLLICYRPMSLLAFRLISILRFVVLKKYITWKYTESLSSILTFQMSKSICSQRKWIFIKAYLEGSSEQKFRS